MYSELSIQLHKLKIKIINNILPYQYKYNYFNNYVYYRPTLINV